MPRYIDTEKTDDVIENELSVYDTTELKEMLKYFPKEDVAPVVHAHWILVYTNSMVNYQHMFQCSKCKNAYWMYKDKRRMWKYCPHCGAKMDGQVDKSFE